MSCWSLPLHHPASIIHTSSLRLTPEPWAVLCQANPDAVVDLAANGSLIRMTPRASC